MASSSSSSSSSHTIPPHHLLPHYAGPTSAPPPTPSTHPTSSTPTTAAAADTLTRLLHRLPPTLSFPTRRLSPPPLPTSLTTSSLQLGYFQLCPDDHHLSSQLASSAESEAASLFNSTTLQKHTLFPINDWPLGFHGNDDDDDDDDDYTTSFCFDGRTTTTTTELASLTELTRELEKVGLDVVGKLASMMGFDNPFGENESGSSSPLMWVSLLEAEKTGRVYPYVVGLQYQIRARKWKLASDVGSVEVEPEVGSILVTFGDIAQVWSNGKLNKIRGRPTGVSEDRARSGSHGISMTMLLTLPLETTVSPLLPLPAKIDEKDDLEPVKDCKESNDHQSVESKEKDDEDGRVFNSFSFEDYAWRVYHDRLHLKDPLDRYRRLRH
ncbi:uncharacterized protein LOC141605574 [Silene latifolia]|uniref:uncharacterized protein LOC141605574 n=1 Tax=Silene latifolia TaxID=37657 RepID=UPI003D778D14